jgi:hypothetical protein
MKSVTGQPQHCEKYLINVWFGWILPY